jgi:hypothetical protein
MVVQKMFALDSHYNDRPPARKNRSWLALVNIKRNLIFSDGYIGLRLVFDDFGLELIGRLAMALNFQQAKIDKDADF